MKYTLTYARVGNARPIYSLSDQYGENTLCLTVEDVFDELTINLPLVRKLCRRARNGEVVEFFQ